MSGHAPAAPSSLDAIVKCDAFLQMNEPYKDAPRTPEQLEGDAGHWVAAQYATSLDYAATVGTMTPQGLLIDLDMIQGAELWRDVVGVYGFSETPVQIPRVHPTHCWGTPDNWQYDPIEGVLRVRDYKYGHLFVEVFECWQVIAYALGLIDFLQLNDQETKVEFTIVQPRAYDKRGPVRRWTVRADDLRAYANIAAGAVERSLLPNPKATTGPQCEFCAGRHECKTLQHASYAVVDYSATMDRTNLPALALGAELNILTEGLNRLEARRIGLLAQAEAYLRSGQVVPGWGMEPGQAKLKWDLDVPGTIAAGDALGVDWRADVKPVTPTQAKALRGANKLDEAVIDALASRPPGAMKLTQTSNIEARKIFGVLSK